MTALALFMALAIGADTRADAMGMLEKIEREAQGVLLHPENSRERAHALDRWATDVTKRLAGESRALRIQAVELEMAARALASAAKREDPTDVRSWATAVGVRARQLAAALERP